MKQSCWALAAACVLLVGMSAGEATFAQKPGEILKVYHWDSPASMSIHEEATYSTVVPTMGVFNNLVIYDQDVPQNSLQSIIPDLAPSWSWSEDGTQLTFRLRDGVKWHDGRSVYGQGCPMYMGPFARQVAGEAAHQPAKRLGTRTWSKSPLMRIWR